MSCARNLLRLAAALVALALAPAGGRAQSPRTLFVLLDAVPFSIVEELTDPEGGDGALFPGFKPPVPLISTFPSSTSVAAVGILEPFGMRHSPGYEARFFDRSQRRVRGGGAISYFRIDFPWREFFDWSRKGVARSAFAALWPVRASISRLDEAVERFFRSDAREFFVYIETTDTAAHLQSPASLVRVFRALDLALREARRRHPEVDYRVVLFSDHGIAGGVPLENTFRPAQEALEAAGFSLSRRVESPRDVALTPFGLVSSFEAYTEREAAPRVAEALAGVEGVDLCVHRDRGGWVIESRRGRAIVRSLEGLWSYDAETGDPLAYEPVVERLAARAGGTRAFPDDWWLDATGTHHYPDALFRVARAFEIVENPASVLCSLEPGFMYGLVTTSLGARLANGPLRWTHGALFREASWGFLMSDDPDWRAKSPLRFSRALAPFVTAADVTGDPRR